MGIFLLCIKIFFARIIDVSLGTIRTIFTVRGKTLIAGIIAFIEVFIWFVIVKEAMNTELKSLWIIISYAGGYATGTILGTYISKRFINSLITVEIYSSKITEDDVNILRKDGFGVSVVQTKYNYDENDKNILFITLNSKNLNKLKQIVTDIDDKVFMVINESKIVYNGFIK